MCGQRSEDLELAGGESGQAEQGEPFRKVRDRCVVKEPITCALPTLGRPGQTDLRPEVTPELRLPDRICRQVSTAPIAVETVRPGENHLRAMKGVAVEA